MPLSVGDGSLSILGRFAIGLKSRILSVKQGIRSPEMGWNNHITSLSLEADAVAVQARAIKHCNLHDHIWIDRSDPEANKHAYALGTIRWMNGDMGCTREEFMAAIDEVIAYAADECPACVLKHSGTNNEQDLKRRKQPVDVSARARNRQDRASF